MYDMSYSILCADDLVGIGVDLSVCDILSFTRCTTCLLQILALHQSLLLKSNFSIRCVESVFYRTTRASNIIANRLVIFDSILAHRLQIISGAIKDNHVSTIVQSYYM